jgi:hypothetical protein
MNDTRSRITFALFAFVPYILVSWAYMAIVSGNSREFWSAFGVLIGARFFFSVIETIGSILSWRLYGKKLMTRKFLFLLQSNNFPKREYEHDDFSNYLARIDDGLQYSMSIKTAAKDIYSLLSTYESIGILLGARMHAASEAALDAYSPKSEAPVFGAHATQPGSQPNIAQ